MYVGVLPYIRLGYNGDEVWAISLVRVEELRKVNEGFKTPLSVSPHGRLWEAPYRKNTYKPALDL